MEGLSDKKKTFEAVSNYDISLSEELKRVFSLDKQCKPELIVGKSEILDIDDVEKIVRLVLTARSCSWSLAYSASIHERSLSGMYKRIDYVADNTSPFLILIKDMEKHVHGVFISNFMSSEVNPSENSAGALFHCRPHFHLFHNVREQTWSLRKTGESLSIVDMSAKSGIWLNGSLTEGKMEEYLPTVDAQKNPITEHCFYIKTLECWMLSEIQSSSTLPI